MTHDAMLFWFALVCGGVIGGSVVALWRPLLRWAEGLRIEVAAERVIEERRSQAPRSLPTYRNVRLVPRDEGPAS